MNMTSKTQRIHPLTLGTLTSVCVDVGSMGHVRSVLYVKLPRLRCMRPIHALLSAILVIWKDTPTACGRGIWPFCTCQPPHHACPLWLSRRQRSNPILLTWRRYTFLPKHPEPLMQRNTSWPTATPGLFCFCFQQQQSCALARVGRVLATSRRRRKKMEIKILTLKQLNSMINSLSL